MSRPNELYMIVVSDNASDMYRFGVPEENDHPHVVFTTVSDAKRGLESFIKIFDGFIPAAYGEVYPFESVTFEQEIQRSGSALYGWATLKGEDEETVSKVGISLLRLRIV
jgi:hypothetical protein